jgi:hypothetical protein
MYSNLVKATYYLIFDFFVSVTSCEADYFSRLQVAFRKITLSREALSVCHRHNRVVRWNREFSRRRYTVCTEMVNEVV